MVGVLTSGRSSERSLSGQATQSFPGANGEFRNDGRELL